MEDDQPDAGEAQNDGQKAPQTASRRPHSMPLPIKQEEIDNLDENISESEGSGSDEDEKDMDWVPMSGAGHSQKRQRKGAAQQQPAQTQQPAASGPAASAPVSTTVGEAEQTASQGTAAAGGKKSGGSAAKAERAAKGVTKTPRQGGRFSGRLPSKQDEVTLAEECVKLAPLLGAVTESRKFTLANLVRSIATGGVRRHLLAKERALEELQGQLSQLRATLESQGVVLDQGSGQFVTQRPVSQQLPRQHHAATSQHLSRHRPHTEPLYGTDVHGNPSSSSWQGMGPEASAGSAVFQGAAALQQQGPGQGQGQGQAPGRPHSGSMLSGEGAMMQVPMHPSSSMRPHRMDMPLYDMDAWAPGPGPGVVLPRSQYLAMQQQAPGHVPPGGAHMPQPRFMSGPLTVAMQQQQQQQQQHPAHWGHGMQQHQAPRTVRRPVSGDISASGGYVMAPGPGPSESYPGVLLPEQSQYYYAAQQPGCAGGPYAHPAPHAPPLAPTAPPRRPHTITFPHNIRQQQQGAGGGYVMAPDGGMTGMGGQDMQMHAPAGMEAGAGMPQQQQQQQFMFAQHQEMMVKQEMRAMSGATGAESAGMMPLRQQQQPQLGNLVAIPQGHMSQPGVPAQAAVTAPPPPHPAASAQAGGTPPAAAAAHLGPGAVNSPSQTFSSDIDDGYGLGEAWELLPPTLPAPPGFPGAGPAYRGPGDPYNATSHPSAGYPPISLPPRGYQSAAAAGGVLGPRDLQVPHAQHFHSGAIASHKQTVTTPPAPGTGADSPVQVLGQVPYTREQIPGSGAQQGQQPVRPYSAPVFGSDAATFARPPDHIVGLVPGAPNLGPGPGSVTGGAPGYTSQGSHQGVGAFSFSPPGLQTLGRVSSLQEIWEDMEMTQPLQGSDAFLGGPPLGGDQPGAVTPAAAAAAGGADGRLQAAAAQAQQLQTAQVTAGGTSAAAAGPDTAQQSLDMNMLRIGSMGSQA